LARSRKRRLPWLPERGTTIHQALGTANKELGTRKPMKLSRSTAESHSFVLEENGLRRICDKLSGFFATICITAKCADKLDREFASVDELMRFTNPAKSAIQELSIYARDADWRRSFRLSLANKHYANVYVSIEADDASAPELNSLADDAIESMRPWFSWIARVDWYWLVFQVWIIWWLGFLLLTLVLHGDRQIIIGRAGPISTHALLRSATVGLMPSLAGLALNLVRNQYFPIGTFAVANGKARHDQNEIIRTVIIAGLAISIITSAMFYVID